jgi:hypothetical protein
MMSYPLRHCAVSPNSQGGDLVPREILIPYQSSISGTQAILKFDGNLNRVRNLCGISNGHMTC